MTHFPNFGHEKNFPKLLILGPKIPNLHHFGHKRNFSQKKDSFNFMFIEHYKIHAKNQKKSNEPILKKQHQRRTDRWMDGES